MDEAAVETEGRCGRCGRQVSVEDRYCSGCGAPLTSPPPRREERKLVSVLFVDLEAFTASADQADPEDVRDALARFHSVAREQIEAYGGVVEKFIGDAVMAVFGAPVSHGDDAERAVRAGLRVLEAVDVLVETGFRLGARAAVNTGEAVVTVDRGDAGEPLAIGDVVNTAARLQAAAPAGRLVVGAETRRATRRVIGYDVLPAVIAKGKTAPVEAWLATDVLAGPADRPSLGGRFVGRDRELDLLRSVWRQAAAERRPHVVTVVGPPGIGKSRLCRQFEQEVEAEGARPLRSRCLPYEEQTGYHASAQLVRQAFGIFDSDPEDVARSKLERGVAALLPPQESSDTTRYLALVLGLGIDAPVFNQRLLFLAVRRMLERLGDERPTLVVVEDIHWGSSSELDLLEYLGAQLRDSAAVLMVLARPELLDERAWGARLPAHSSITLDPLSADESIELARSLAEGASPAEQADGVARLAEGNPLFVEELTAALADGVADAGMPVTVTAAIAARLDALPAHVRAVLLSASVVGRTFWRDAVAALSSSLDADVALDELERRDLVRREPASRLEGDVEYRFRHALIRDVAYATLPRAERAARHADVARYVEGRAGDDAGPIAWVLAHHWREAGEPARALTHLLSAASVAERGWATREVVDLYSLALELTEDPLARASIRLRRGIALKTLDADHEAARELAAVLPELQGAERLDGLLYAGRAEIWCERHDEALRYGDQALAFAEELGDEDGGAAARALISNALAMRGDDGDIERALRVGDDALAAWRPGTRGYEHADHLHLQADAKYWTGDYAACVDYAIRAREAAGDAHSAHALLRGGGIEAMARLGLGEFETALATLETHFAIGVELGYAAAFMANYRSAVYRELHDLEAARDASRAALDASESSAFEMPRRFALSDLLQADLLAGDIGRAQAAWPELWADASEASGWTRWLIRGRLAVARAEIALHAEPPEAAAEAAATAVDITSRTLRRKYEAEARSHLGRALVTLGRRNEGVTELRAAVRLADSLVSPSGRWRSRTSLAAGLAGIGDDRGAAVATREAQAILAEFAGSLAPERAAAFLAAPPVRAVVEAVV